MPVTVIANRAVSSEHRCSIEIPTGWEVRDVFRAALGVEDPDAIINLAPKTAQLPNIEITNGGKVSNPSPEEARKFAHRLLGRMGWPIIEERTLTVSGYPAYEVSYQRKSPWWMFWTFHDRRKHHCKVSVVRDEQEYLIQLAVENWPADKELFDRCVQSFQFT